MLSESSRFIQDAKACTILPATPTLLGALKEPGQYENIRGIFLGGESPSPELVRRWWTPQRSMYNAYGPTEATIAVSMAELRPDQPITLGRAITNSQMILLDSDMENCTEGEICITGISLAFGYYKQATQTAEKFIQWKGQRLYRTSDLGRRTENGIIFLGRKDDIVKNRGFLINIEAEVIPPLLAQIGVQAATAFMHNRRLIAFVAPTVNASEMRQKMSHQYDSFLVPDEIRTLPDLPRTANGKADIKTLKSQLEEKANGVNKKHPKGPRLEVLKAVVACVLDIPATSVNEQSSFWDLGGNSLSAIKLLSHLQTIQLSIPFADLFRLPSITAIADRLQVVEGKTQTHHGVKDAITPAETTAFSPVQEEPESARMTATQMGIVRSTIREPTAGYMLVSMSLNTTSQEVEIAKLNGAWEAVLGRHSPFRTEFDVVNQAQIIKGQYTHNWEERRCIDEGDMDFLVNEESVALFDLARHTQRDGNFCPVNAFRLVTDPKGRSILLWLIHHSLVDGWSIGVIVKEVRSMLRGKTLTQAPQFWVYSDAVQLHATGIHNEARRFWTESMANVLDGTPLNISRPDAPSLAARFGDESLSLGLAMPQVETSARAYGVSPAVMIYAAWALLLGNYTFKDTVVFGTAFSGRNFPTARAEQIVGPMINTCPLPVNLREAESKGNFLDYVQTLLLNIGEYQWSAASILQEIAAGSHSGIFDTVVFLEYDLPEFSDGWKENGLTPWKFHRQDVPEFGLAVVAEKVDGELSFRMQFDRSLYEEPIIRRMLAHLRNLYLAIMDPRIHQTQDIRDRMLEATEFMQLTRNSPCFFDAYTGPSNLKDSFENGADKWPNATAAESPLGTLTYSELDRMANFVAGRITDLSKPKKTVAIVSDGTLNWLVGVISIIKAGAVYLPLDPKLPSQRMRIMIETAGAALCIFPNQECARDFASVHPQRLLLHDVLEASSNLQQNRLDTITGPDDYAYVIFTSGSTGVPKGVRVKHGATVSHLAYEPARLHARPGRRHAQMFSPGFDVNIAEIFGCLCYGATLVLKDPRDPFAHLTRVHATMITPSFLSLCRPEEYENLDSIYLIGEAIPQSLSDQWSAGRVVYNAYGPCECTIAALFARLRPNATVTLGRAIPRVGLYVLDPHGRPAPIGVTGEICLSGIQVMEGYIGADMETVSKARFVPDPFLPQFRMYHTGDLGVWTESMEVRFLGRVDNQVKVRGHRVELEEVENVIRSVSPTITQAAAIVSGNNIFAFVAPDTVDVNMIQQAIRSQLPTYACPTTTTALSSLPTTPNQKLDRKALTAMIRYSSKRVSKPRSEMELLLGRIWKETIGLQGEFEIGPEDDFLALGGNSLRQITMAQRLSAAFGIKVPLRVLIANTNMLDLAKALDEYRSGVEGSITKSFLALSETPPASRSALSYLEEELYTMHEQSSTPSTFNVAYELHLHGKVDLDDLEGAITKVVMENKILTTCFASQAGKISRIPCESEFRVLRCRNLTEQQKDEYINQTFDLAQDTLTRVALVDESNRATILFVQHHIITDKSSVRMFFKKVQHHLTHPTQQSDKLLASANSNTENDLSYSTWAHWRASKVLTDNLEAANVQYWTSQLAGSPLGPFTQGSLVATNHGSALCSFSTLSSVNSQGSLELYLAVVSLALHKVLGLSDLVIGVPYIDRSEPGTEEILGLFLDRLPIRLRPGHDGVPDVLDIVTSARTAVKGALSHALPYTEIRKLTGRATLFDVMLVHNRKDDLISSPLYITDVTIEEVPRRARGAKFPLLIEFNETATGMECEIEYFEDLVAPTTVDRIKDEIVNVLRGMADHS